MRSRLRPANTRLRVHLLTSFLVVGSVLLVARAADLQLLHNEFYQKQGDARFLREIPIPTSRGMITDRNGEPLAVSTPVESIWADPRQLLQHAQRLPELAAALGTDPEALAQRLSERAEREFIYLRRQMSPDEAAQILALDIPGVNSLREFRRFYPLGDMAAHVLGFTNIDDRGQEGLELAFDEWLSGKPGAKKVIRDRLGRVVENVDLVRAAEPGRALNLSIDRRIQHLAFRELKAALAEHGASSGSAVVLEIATGEILAMVNLPSYNPNARSEGNAGARRNRAVTDVFEPGSVIKVLTVAAALETGRYQPDTPIETHPGFIRVGGHTIPDIRNFGVVSPTRLLTKSSNVAATKLALDMPNEHLHDVLRRFGLGEVTGSGFPGESAGVLPGPRGWGELEKATISYGYGISTTALQLAQLYAAIGNGGVLMTPTFIHGAENPGRSVIDPALAGTLVGMLETVTGPEGSAQRARVSGYRVAGKTGTSRRSVVGGYEKRYVSLFAGLVPASAPRYSMVVMINDPTGEHYFGGIVSAPVFARVMQETLRLLDVMPDDVQQWYVAAPPEPPPLPASDALPPEAEVVPDTFPVSGAPR